MTPLLETHHPKDGTNADRSMEKRWDCYLFLNEAAKSLDSQPHSSPLPPRDMQEGLRKGGDLVICDGQENWRREARVESP